MTPADIQAYTMWATVVGAAAVVGALLVGWVQLTHIAATRTFDVVARLYELWEGLYDQRQTVSGLMEAGEKATADLPPDQLEAYKKLASFFDLIAIGVNHNAIPARLVVDAFGRKLILSFYSTFDETIRARRQTVDPNLLQNLARFVERLQRDP